MKYKFSIIAVLIFIYTLYSILYTPIVSADTIVVPEPKVGIPSSTELGTILGNFINIIFAIGGIGTFFYFLWGAVEWIFSGGDKEKVGNARKRMTHAIIGLALLALSFFLLRLIGFVINFDPTGELNIPALNE